jgi:hypothetical protein
MVSGGGVGTAPERSEFKAARAGDFSEQAAVNRMKRNHGVEAGRMLEG